ncbi:MAG: hypothetical protein AAGL89_01620 [Pseudomonadota bacterium]
MKNALSFKAFFSAFRADEAGAVTTDFVVITGAIIGLSLAVMSSLANATVDLADETGWTIASIALSPDDEAPGPPRD